MTWCVSRMTEDQWSSELGKCCHHTGWIVERSGITRMFNTGMASLRHTKRNRIVQVDMPAAFHTPSQRRLELLRQMQTTVISWTWQRGPSGVQRRPNLASTSISARPLPPAIDWTCSNFSCELPSRAASDRSAVGVLPQAIVAGSAEFAFQFRLHLPDAAVVANELACSPRLVAATPSAPIDCIP
jgi:hypothetical protein